MEIAVLERMHVVGPKHRRALTAELLLWVLGSENPKQAARKVSHTDECLTGGQHYTPPTPGWNSVNSTKSPGNSYRHLVYL